MVLCGTPLAQAQVLLPGSGGSSIIGSGVNCPNEAPFIKVTDGVAGCAVDPGAGAGAPTTATYLTRTPDGTLSAEQALSALASGLMINTTTSGVVSIYAGGQCTNQVIEDLSASGAPTCVSITNAYIADSTIQAAKLAFTPIKSGDAAGGDLTGTYPNPTIAPNSVALATDTTGRYVGKLTAGDNISLENCPSSENVDCTINATDAQTAAQVPFTPFDTVEATNVQAAIEEVFAEASGGGGTDDQTAAEVPFTPAGTIAATDTQAAIEEVSDDLTAHEADTTNVHGIEDTSVLVTQTTLNQHIDDATDAHDASAISVVPFGTIGSNTVQAALEEIFNESTAGQDNQTAAEVPFTPFATIAATDVQAAIEELFNESTAGQDDQTAAEVPFTPTGTIAATDTQAAVAEVASEAAAALAAHDADTTDVHGIANTSTLVTQTTLDAHVNDATSAHAASAIGFTPTGTIAGTDLATALAEVANEAIQTSTKDAPSGVAGLTSNTKLKIAQLGSYHAHTALSAGSQITPEQLFVGIQGATTPVTLTNAQPITGGVASQPVALVGLHATNTVTLTAGTNLVLCGSEPSVTVGIGLQTPWFKKDPTGTIWRRTDCGSGYPFINRNIAADETSKVCEGDIANQTMQCRWTEAGVNRSQGYTGGVEDTVTTVEDLNVEGDVTLGGAVHGLVHSASVGLAAPTTAENGFIQFEWPAEVTLQEIQCSTNTGTVTINIEERARATPNTTGTEALTADLVCDSDGAVSTTFTDAVQAANVPIALQIAAVASTPGVVRVHIKAVRN